MKRPVIALHFLVILTLLLLPVSLFAHTINYALQDAPVTHVTWYYLGLGFNHIIPAGADHMLFVAGLCLISRNVKAIIWQATAFTVAHSITLALGMKNIIVAPGAVVEPVIALSIVFIAVENLLLNELKPWRVVLVFAFGLVHGLGFASSLNEIGLPPGQFALSIVSFNVGVELGQLCVIMAIFLLLVKPWGRMAAYRQRVVYPVSIAIGLVALGWTVQAVVE